MVSPTIVVDTPLVVKLVVNLRRRSHCVNWMVIPPLTMSMHSLPALVVARPWW